MSRMFSRVRRGLEGGTCTSGVGWVDDLRLEVGEVHCVEVDDAKPSDAGGGKIQAEWRTQTAGADQQDLGLHELLLALNADLRDDEVPAVAEDLVTCERGHGSDRRHVSCLLSPVSK